MSVPTAALPLWLSPCLHFFMELFTRSLHAHKALACHGTGLQSATPCPWAPKWLKSRGLLPGNRMNQSLGSQTPYPSVVFSSGVLCLEIFLSFPHQNLVMSETRKASPDSLVSTSRTALLPRTRHCSKHGTRFNPLNSHSNPEREVLLFSSCPFYRWGNWCIPGVDHLPRVTVSKRQI